jgi:hypothetical protein
LVISRKKPAMHDHLQEVEFGKALQH